MEYSKTIELTQWHKTECDRGIAELCGMLEYLGLGSWAKTSGKITTIGTGDKTLLAIKDVGLVFGEQTYSVKRIKFYPSFDNCANYNKDIDINGKQF